MKGFVLTMLLVFFVSISIPVTEDIALAEGNAAKSDLVSRLWIKLRALSPKHKVKVTTAVAGTKGAEKGSESLTPAWIGEERSEEGREIERYRLLEELAAKEDFAELSSAVTVFQLDFPQARLLPNAILMKALSLLKLDKEDEAKVLLRDFKEKYPDQEMHNEAQALLELIESGKAAN